MKKIFLIIAFIASITACTKPETPQPEPEPESYIGYLRSEHPNIKISGVSINDKIIYDLKSAFSYCEEDYSMIELYSDIYTTIEEILAPELQDPDSSDPNIKYGRRVIPKSTIRICSSEIELYIYEKTFDEHEIICKIGSNGQNALKTDNVESFKFKDTSFDVNLVKHENDILYYEADTCRFDVEITLNNGNVIEIVYYGASIHCPVRIGIPTALAKNPNHRNILAIQ